MMDQLIADFPAQLRTAIEIGKKAQATFTKATQPIHNIVTVGLGGSGIGANFTIELTEKERSIPMLTSKGYSLPNFVNENSLVICSSYSGNTEETLAGFEQALQTGAKIMVVTSGGKLLEMAKEKGLDHVALPNDGHPPRACLGLSLIQQLFILNFYGHCSDETLAAIETAAELIIAEQEAIRLKANRIAKFMVGKFPIIYTSDRMGAVAVRFRQQLNENGKILCSHHIVPEMNHNELVGWRKQPNEFAVLLLRSAQDHPRNQTRFDINKEIISNYTNTVIEIMSKGKNLMEEVMYLVHLGDWISYEVAQLREVDAVEVKVIDYLKSELKKQ